MHTDSFSWCLVKVMFPYSFDIVCGSLSRNSASTTFATGLSPHLLTNLLNLAFSSPKNESDLYQQSSHTEQKLKYDDQEA